MVTGIKATPSATAVPTVSPEGIGIGFDTTDGVQLDTNQKPFANGVARTCFALIDLPAATFTDNQTIYSAGTVSARQRWDFLVRATGVLRFEIQNGTATSALSVNAGFNTVGLAGSGSNINTYRFFLNGSFESSAINKAVETGSTFTGRWGNSILGGTDREMGDGSILLGMLFSVKLTDFWFLSLERDPYQLRPDWH